MLIRNRFWGAFVAQASRLCSGRKSQAGRLCYRAAPWPVLALLAIGLAGCAHATSPLPLDGPRAAAPLELRPWTFGGEPAFCLASPHYLIYTTVEDRQLLTDVGQLMEGALAEYGRLGAGVPPGGGRPLVCYLFANRAQWAQFTSTKTGGDARIYLQINRGGYTVGDWYVAYYLGRIGTFSVTAHEGFHQYVARHMRTRIPPFLEEGLACMFEDVQWEAGLPRWDLGVNVGRDLALARAVEKHELFPLADLVAMHAGQVVSQPRGRVAAFYAECWAFAEFLWEAEGGRYRPSLRRMLADATAGTLWGESFTRAGADLLWNPRSARPLLEHYLDMPLPEIDGAFQRYMRGRSAHFGRGSAAGE